MTKDDSNFMKGIAILMMVAHHLWGFPSRFDCSAFPHIYTTIGLACKICVSMFLFISGYGLAKSWIFSGFTYKKSWDKIKRLYVCFWKVFFVFIPIGFLFGYYEFHWNELFLNIFCIDYSYNEEWWFLPLYMEILLVFPLLCKIRNVNVFLIVAVVSIALTKFLRGYIGWSENLAVQHAAMFCYYWGIFMVGVLCAKYDLMKWVNQKVSQYMGRWKICALGFFAFILFFIRQVFNLPILNLFFVPAVTLFIISFPLPIFFKNSMAWLGCKHSMNIWLIHTFICYYYWQSYLLMLKFPILLYIALVGISLLFSIILNAIWEHGNHCKLKRLVEGVR